MNARSLEEAEPSAADPVGCGHAGDVTTLEHAKRTIRDAPVHAGIGGLHLFRAPEEVLERTGGGLRAMGVEHLLAEHCTGIEAAYRLRLHAGLDRGAAVVSAVGSGFSLASGIDPLTLAR